MIPKIIHYCWLRKDKKPETIRKCIASWGRYFPEYEIRLWDMGSFDFDSVPFTKEAAMQSWSYKPITVVVFDASYNRSKRTFYLRPNATFPEVFSE